MRNRKFFLCLGLSLTLYLLISLTGRPLPQSVKPQTYRLAFSPPVGATLVYTLITRMNSEGQSFLGKSLFLNVTASGEIDLSIRQVTRESVLTELTTPGIPVSVQTSATTQEYTLRTPEGSPVEVIIDKSGRTRDIRNSEALEEQNLLNFSILEALRTYLPVYPEKPVSIGDSWTDHKRLSIPFQGMDLIIELEIVFMLNDVLPSPDGKIALISAACTVTLQGSRPLQEVVAAFKGKGSGTGSLNLLVEKGCFSEYRLDYSIDGAMIIRKAKTNLMEWPFSLAASASLVLVEWR